jgi:muconolactone delta-isomerase
MKFLVMPIQKQTLSPDMGLTLIEATIQWKNQAKGSGKFDTIYSVAGQPGGLAIVNVDSLEELDDLIAEYPMTPFCDVQVLPLSDVDRAMAKQHDLLKKITT